MTAWHSLITALLLGATHALDVDHMIAVSTFLTHRPGIRAAVRFGARWGVGHAIAVFVVGGLLILSGVHWPPRYDGIGELLVGLMLIGIGIWAIHRAKKLHLHPPEEHGDHLHLHAHPDGLHPHHHAHAHSAAGTTRHRHGTALVLVGLLHGLAGSSAAVALVPVTMIHHTGAGLAYLAVFGLGVIGAMMAFAVVATFAITRATSRSIDLSRMVGILVGVAGVAVGVWWLIRALGALTG